MKKMILPLVLIAGAAYAQMGGGGVRLQGEFTPGNIPVITNRTTLVDSGQAPGAQYDQSLNTTNNVEFAAITAGSTTTTNLTIDGEVVYPVEFSAEMTNSPTHAISGAGVLEVLGDGVFAVVDGTNLVWIINGITNQIAVVQTEE